MIATRKTALSLLILASFGISLFDMVTGREDFPFAPYSMYAGIYRPVADGKPPYETLVVAFVTRDGREQESHDDWVSPFDNLRLMQSLEKVSSDRAKIHSKLVEVLERHRAGYRRPGTPDFVGIRLYRQTARSGQASPSQTGMLQGVSLLDEYFTAGGTAK